MDGKSNDVCVARGHRPGPPLAPRMVIWLAAGVCSLMLGACGMQAVKQGEADPNAGAGSELVLHGVQWIVEDIGGQAVLADAGATLNFAPDGRVWGSTGCNRYSGGYERSGLAIGFTGVAVTRMACAQPVMHQETRFLQVLESAQRVHTASNGLLVIGSDSGEIRARGG